MSDNFILVCWKVDGLSIWMLMVNKQFSVGKKLQIFDLDKKEMIKDHSLDEDVVFWTWIDEETIGAVTESAVYHWALASEFIINFKLQTNSDEWHHLCMREFF